MTERREPGRVPDALYIAALLGVLLMLTLAHAAAEQYRALMQEDRVAEWWTTTLFATAGALRLHAAVRARRPFDLLVGIFCLFVAGEEISWGQRLLGFTPPGSFLEHNAQQEANLHNLAGVIGKPKWALAVALAGYGLLLPALARLSRPRRILLRIGATAAPMSLAPIFGLAIGLLIWYPVDFTGEWVELLAGSLFLATAGLSGTTLAVHAVWTLGAALLMTQVSARGGGDLSRTSCARTEVTALLRDLSAGRAATEKLLSAGSIHKRVWTAVTDGYVDWREARELEVASCAGLSTAETQRRRRYGIDPWGTAYWIRVEAPTRDEHRVLVYSFGPNRRRDFGSDERRANGADDVVAVGTLPTP